MFDTLMTPRSSVAAGIDADAPELSIVMPCLNEADTIESCLRKAWDAIREHDLAAEIVVADNGSTDGSPDIAERLGARVVQVSERGYGHALMAGIAAARGRFIIMGDADDSYDFHQIQRFVDRLREGYDLVQGCRLPSGGGTVMPGAMPFLHRWWGNPMFSFLAKQWFGSPIHDVNCGLRGFTKAHYERLDQQCTGMEFAVEMIIKSSVQHARIAEVPITLHPDGRKAHPPHLRTFRDGWRTLRYYMLYSPRWLFLVPGALLMVLGAVAYLVAMPAMAIGGVGFDVHTLLFGSLAIICGYQAIVFAFFTKVFAINEGLMPEDRRMRSLLQAITLEKGLAAAGIALLVGVALLGAAILQWKARNFGALNPEVTLRWVIPGVTLTTLGVQTFFSSFFLSILGLSRR